MHKSIGMYIKYSHTFACWAVSNINRSNFLNNYAVIAYGLPVVRVNNNMNDRLTE